jgi:hypothetical protein
VEKFLPRYVNSELNLPKEYKFDFDLFFEWFAWHFVWTNIEYSEAQLDIADIKLRFSHRFDKRLIKFDFPAIKEWEIKAHQHVNSWILPHESDVKLVIKDFDVDFDSDLKLDENGYLDPIVWNADVKFGETFLYHENKFIGFIMHQLIEYLILVIKDSVYFLGGTLFSQLLGPVLDKALNHYRFDIRLPSPFIGQTTSGDFIFDYRNVYSPVINEGYADFYFAGEILHGETAICDLEHDYMNFANTDVYSQLVVSESAATCAMNNFANSPIGKISLDK